jgi:hypothetical protein
MDPFDNQLGIGRYRAQERASTKSTGGGYRTAANPKYLLAGLNGPHNMANALQDLPRQQDAEVAHCIKPAEILRDVDYGQKRVSFPMILPHGVRGPVFEFIGVSAGPFGICDREEAIKEGTPRVGAAALYDDEGGIQLDDVKKELLVYDREWLSELVRLLSEPGACLAEHAGWEAAVFRGL